jgi:hypothetical protein
MPPGGLSKLRPLENRHRQPIRIALLYVCWRVENGSIILIKTTNKKYHTVGTIPKSNIKHDS